jgi:hypothetical protein
MAGQLPPVLASSGEPLKTRDRKPAGKPDEFLIVMVSEELSPSEIAPNSTDGGFGLS